MYVTLYTMSKVLTIKKETMQGEGSRKREDDESRERNTLT